MGDPGGAAVLLRFLRIQGFLCLFLLPQTGSVLEVIARSPHVAQKGSNTLIPCTFRVNKFPADPKFLAIYWDFNGRRILTYDNVVSTTDPRFSLDPSSALLGNASLSVSNAQISDGGAYSCSVTYSPEWQQKEIIVEIQAPPQITITNRVVTENKESALSASIIGFYPLNIDIIWLRDGEILPWVTVNKPHRDPDGTYSTTSTVTIVPTEGNRNQIFSVQVQHESLSVPLQEDFQLLYAAAPSIHISHGSFYVNEEQTLMCQVWGYYPEDIAVSWFLDGSWVEPSEIKRINSSALELPYRFLPTAESQGMEISCVVEHRALTEPLVQSLKVELTDAQWSNRVIIIITIVAVALMAVAAVLILKKMKRCCFRTGNREEYRQPDYLQELKESLISHHPVPPKLQEPVEMALRKGGVVDCTAVLQNFYPDSITVQWVYENGTIHSNFNSSENEDGETFDASSSCRIRWPDFHNGVKIIWKHQSGGREWREELQELRETDFPWRPVVAEILTPDLYVGTEAEILCPISGYFPDKLTVTWYKKKESGREELVNNGGRYKIPDIQSQEQADRTLTCTARLAFSPSLSEEHGAEFICRVAHPSLGEAIERRTATLYVRESSGLNETQSKTGTETSHQNEQNNEEQEERDERSEEKVENNEEMERKNEESKENSEENEENNEEMKRKNEESKEKNKEKEERHKRNEKEENNEEMERKNEESKEKNTEKEENNEEKEERHERNEEKGENNGEMERKNEESKKNNEEKEENNEEMERKDEESKNNHEEKEERHERNEKEENNEEMERKNEESKEKNKEKEENNEEMERKNKESKENNEEKEKRNEEKENEESTTGEDKAAGDLLEQFKQMRL